MEEKKEAQASTEEEIEEEESEEESEDDSESSASDDNEKSSSQEDKVDHKAAIEELENKFKDTKDTLDKAEYTIEKEKKEKKKLREELEKRPELDEESIDKIVNERVSRLAKDIRSDVVEESISELTDDPDEAKHIELLYENRIVHSGYSRSQIKQDLLAAYAMANQPKMQNTLKEVEALKNSKKARSSGSGSSQGQGDDSEEQVKLDPESSKIAKAFGLDSDEVKSGKVKRTPRK